MCAMSPTVPSAHSMRVSVAVFASRLIELQRDPSQAKNLEPLSPTAINTVGSMAKSSKYR
jgi:hypothetical protein